jgi:hypothetical protein
MVNTHVPYCNPYCNCFRQIRCWVVIADFDQFRGSNAACEAYCARTKYLVGGLPRCGSRLLESAGRCDTSPRTEHHDSRANLHSGIEIDHILIGQPDAAR